MGRNHLQALAESDQVRVTAIAEPAAATRSALPHTDASIHPNLDSMLDAGGLDGVLVCVPSDRHLETVRRLVVAGLPILCEKPVGVAPK
jgi:myo-inositol 2-dehydrogenase / D-chiro-inositol 1-dehydrogenase